MGHKKGKRAIRPFCLLGVALSGFPAFLDRTTAQQLIEVRHFVDVAVCAWYIDVRGFLRQPVNANPLKVFFHACLDLLKHWTCAMQKG